MRIDANIPFDPAQQGAKAGDAARMAGQAKAAKADGTQEVAPSVQSGCGYVQQAQDTPEVDAAAVARVKALLESGQLDTPQAALETAQAMLDKGI